MIPRQTYIRPLILGIAIWVGFVVIIMTDMTKRLGVRMFKKVLITEFDVPNNDDVHSLHHQHSISNMPTEPGVNIGKKTKLILMVSPNHWLNDWVVIQKGWESSNIFKSCPVSNCFLTKNIDQIHVSDVVIVRPSFMNSCRKKLKTGQIWVFMEHESPIYFNKAKSFKKCYRDMFNWTYTFRRDSDFVLAHGYFKHDTRTYDPTGIDAAIKSKTRIAVGFMSHCPVPAQRLEFVRKLNDTEINLDIVGKCGNLICSHVDRHKTAWNLTGHHDPCFDVLNTKYKFYLSFENAFCADYVTEKSLNLIMSRNIVPIIRDGANHTLYHPPGSYIHTSEFPNVHQLALYILSVANNETRYRQYFEWRKHYAVHGIDDILQNNFCEMCKRSHNPEKYRRLYYDVSKALWNYGGISACVSPTDV